MSKITDVADDGTASAAELLARARADREAQAAKDKARGTTK